jgi:hypothetical protein
VYDLEAGDYFEHHSRLATAEYLTWFGHWDYCVDENPRALERQEGPWIYGIGEGGCEPLPGEVKQRWSCRFTAFLKPGPILRPTQFLRERETFAAYARQCTADPDVERYRQVARQVETSEDLGWGNKALWSFAEAEAAAQKKNLIETLQMIRGECIGVPTGSA